MAASAKPVARADERRSTEQNRGNGGQQRGQNGRPEKRSARIVQLHRNGEDDREQLRRRLLDRLLASEGRGAISTAADEYLASGFEFPVDQEVQLQLLEHLDEARAREAIEAIQGLLSHEPPMKKPILDQRLRRIEEYAEDPSIREASAELRRAIR